MKLPRIYAYGRLRLTPMRLIPSLSAVDVVGDDRPFRTVARWYQFAWLGWTLNLNVPVSRIEPRWAWDIPSMQTMDAIHAAFRWAGLIRPKS